MNRKPILFAICAFAFMCSTSISAASLTACQETLAKFKELGNVQQMLNESYGYAVMPTIGKGGMGVLCPPYSNGYQL